MALNHLLGREPSLLKLPIHIAGKDECPMWLLRRPALQNREARVRLGAAVEVQPVAVEAPREARLPLKPVRAGDIFKRDAPRRQRRVGSPEPLRATKIRQPRVHAHSRPRANQKRICLRDQRSGAGEGSGHGQVIPT